MCSPNVTQWLRGKDRGCRRMIVYTGYDRRSCSLVVGGVLFKMMGKKKIEGKEGGGVAEPAIVRV